MRLPRVIVAVNMSVDGRVALRCGSPLLQAEEGKAWRELWPASTSELEAARSAELERPHAPDAILEGSGSLVADSVAPDWPEAGPAGPSEDLQTDFLPSAVRERPGHRKWFTVVDGRGRVRWSIKSQGEYDVLVLVARSTPWPYLAYLRGEGISYLVAGEERVDLAVALRRMHDSLGVRTVVSNAGGGLNGALLRAGLVDAVDLLVAPAIVGGLGTPSIFDGPPLAGNEGPARLRLISAEAQPDGLLRLRYEVIALERQ